MNRRVLTRGIAVLLALFLLTVAWGFLFAWRPLKLYRPETIVVPVQPIMTGAEYQLGHPDPYVYSLKSNRGDGMVQVYGSIHTKAPEDPSLKPIREAFEQFSPTVVLCEGRMTGLLFPGLMDPVATYGEPGLVRQLAYARSCRVYSWEPPEDRLVKELTDQGYQPDQIALRLVLAPYFSNLRFGKPSDPNSMVAECLRKKSHWPVIGDQFADVSELDKTWRQYFPDGPEWKDVSDEQTLPGFLGEMDPNLARDQHLFEIITEFVNQGERVFVIAGSSHAVKIESALSSTLLSGKQNQTP